MDAPGNPGSPLARRRSGVLLHLTSLPGSQGCGTLGEAACRFVDFLAESGFGVWQMLPLGPTHDDGSPYLCLSAHAGNPRLIDLQALVQHGWLDSDLTSTESPLLRAWLRFKATASPTEQTEFEQFRNSAAGWLPDYALFMALRSHFNDHSWVHWPTPLRQRDPAALKQARHHHADAIEAICFEQFLFDSQWRQLHRHSRERGVALFGDIPIFVDHNSADVWAHQRQFDLDADGNPRVVAGVPPDYFSATGQRWGNPLFRWEEMEADGFSWWQGRVATQMRYFDLLRIDHFRGFEACWEIPADEPTAMVGRWAPARGEALFQSLIERHGTLPWVAEDLGTITPEVERLMARFDFPGMKILQFAFDGGADNPYLPHNHRQQSVVYTGTHDNDTSLGWYQGLTPTLQERVDEYLGRPGEAMPWPLLRAALASVARLAIIPMQDLLGLDSAHRMNQPGTVEGNWRWRFAWSDLPADLSERLRRLNQLYGRG
jgi:4-alpha-glucanotransferase